MLEFLPQQNLFVSKIHRLFPFSAFYNFMNDKAGIKWICRELPLLIFCTLDTYIWIAMCLYLLSWNIIYFYMWQSFISISIAERIFKKSWQIILWEHIHLFYKFLNQIKHLSFLWNTVLKILAFFSEK